MWMPRQTKHVIGTERIAVRPHGGQNKGCCQNETGMPNLWILGTNMPSIAFGFRIEPLLSSVPQCLKFQSSQLRYPVTCIKLAF